MFKSLTSNAFIDVNELVYGILGKMSGCVEAHEVQEYCHCQTHLGPYYYMLGESVAHSYHLSFTFIAPPHRLLLSLTFIAHFHRSLSSLIFIAHFYRSLLSLTFIAHLNHSFPSLTFITHFYRSLLSLLFIADLFTGD